jgi:hypothetical protein
MFEPTLRIPNAAGIPSTFNTREGFPALSLRVSLLAPASLLLE